MSSGLAGLSSATVRTFFDAILPVSAIVADTLSVDTPWTHPMLLDCLIENAGLFLNWVRLLLK